VKRLSLSAFHASTDRPMNCSALPCMAWGNERNLRRFLGVKSRNNSPETATMDHLLLCDTCDHPAFSHNGSGCDSCPCKNTLEHVIEDGLEAGRQEMHKQWVSPQRKWATD
jgi:hypothetical protein